jgi:NAD(P)-dependent dehydrogenase (short-subunit alcohol dehydrogenase family)
MMDRTVAGKVAVVTGASRGIGKAVALRLAAEGARVCVTGRPGTPGSRALTGSLSETVEEIEASGGRAVAVAGDLADPSFDHSTIIQTAELELGGGVDILVNNAAAPRTFGIGFLDMSRELFMESVNVNAWAAWQLGRIAATRMAERGSGSIVNVSSRAAGPKVGPPYPPSQVGAQTLYGSTKAMLDRITTGAAMELFELGLAINSLAPEAAVMTENAASLVSLPPTAVEPVEAFVEAVLALCECGPETMTGRVLTSLSLLVELRRPVRSLDGGSLVSGWQPGEIDLARLRPGYLDSNFARAATPVVANRESGTQDRLRSGDM